MLVAYSALEAKLDVDVRIAQNLLFQSVVAKPRDQNEKELVAVKTKGFLSY